MFIENPDNASTGSLERSLAIPNPRNLVSLKRDLATQGLTLTEIHTVLQTHGVYIPAGTDREPIRILPQPGFYRWEHGVNLGDVDILHTRKSPPVFFAVYVFGIGETTREARALRFPVQTGGVFVDAEDRIVDQMVRDGFDRWDIVHNTDRRRSQPIMGLADGNNLINLVQALKYGHFETSGIHYDLADLPNPERGRLYSGWKENDFWPLVVLSNWKAPFWVVCDRENTTDNTKETIISEPFTQDKLAHIGQLEEVILKNILIKN